jgi:hypothetical protein
MAKSYSDQWAELRKAERISRLIFFSWPPGMFVLISILSAIGIAGNLSVGLVFVVWIIAGSIAAHAVLSFKCPRCNNLFFRQRFWKNGLTKKCLHCGLPKWTPNGQSKDEYNKEQDPDDPVIGDQWMTPLQ